MPFCTLHLPLLSVTLIFTSCVPFGACLCVPCCFNDAAIFWPTHATFSRCMTVVAPTKAVKIWMESTTRYFGPTHSLQERDVQRMPLLIHLAMMLLICIHKYALYRMCWKTFKDYHHTHAFNLSRERCLGVTQRTKVNSTVGRIRGPRKSTIWWPFWRSRYDIMLTSCWHHADIMLTC